LGEITKQSKFGKVIKGKEKKKGRAVPFIEEYREKGREGGEVVKSLDVK